MSSQQQRQQPDFAEEAARRDYRAPYSHTHPIPTIQRYREQRSQQEEKREQQGIQNNEDHDESRTRRAFESLKSIWKDEYVRPPDGEVYPTGNRNIGEQPAAAKGKQRDNTQDQDGRSEDESEVGEKQEREETATEKATKHSDPKQKRKEMKHTERDDDGRQVTDPVTHLPIVIHDSTSKDLQHAPENALHQRTGLSSDSKERGTEEKDELQKGYDAIQTLFPPPDLENVKADLVGLYRVAILVGVGSVVFLAGMVVLLLLVAFWREKKVSVSGAGNQILVPLSITITLSTGIGYVVITGIQTWLSKKVSGIWEDEIWDSARGQESRLNKEKDRVPESVAWMNSLISSVWPLINPDLFASVVDMLEDVMQASLPRVIRMVSIDDLGQGSEAIRILDIKWLPTGAADRDVDEEGNIKKGSQNEVNDRAVPGEGKEEDYEDEVKTEDDPEKKRKKKQKKKQQESLREGMEAEQGDFVNIELAFAYRSHPSFKSIKSKAKNAHLYLKFYLPGGIFVPVWVELKGLIGTLRLRLQLMPDPPFFSLCTLTFLGQPKANLSCVPLSKRLPNLMDVPLISTFVQTSIDAALAEYVAPKSLTLDLKDMLVGDDFKKDTVARGVVVIFVKEASGFKEGDGGIGPMDGSSDAYVTCSWAKFGKVISSTRIIRKEQEPTWCEWVYLLVGPEELNADEKLRVQLWDSDKYTADDDLGRVEVGLSELMRDPRTKNRMCERKDRFMGQGDSEKMPGTLSWSVGYYSKTRITAHQLHQQTEDENIHTKDNLKEIVSSTAESKLREATEHDESKELHQQKTQDYKERENALICASSPDPEYPSGILSIQIHNITGLSISSLNKKENEGADLTDITEQSDDLPSSYCTIILNHTKIYKTRTKPKNGNPFFNAGTERFITDWENAEIMIGVRDMRERENNALLGIVYLPLRKVFENRSQVMDSYPLVGGIGYGRVRISLMFRSLEMQFPSTLLGWEYGTLEIKSPITAKPGLPSHLIHHRIKLRTNISRGKMTSTGDGEWTPKHDRDNGSVFLAVRKRFSCPLIIEFRKNKIGKDKTSAFGVVWLMDIVDEEDCIVKMQVWRGGKEELKRAGSCVGYQGLEGEEPLGEIELRIRFWRGLGGFHKKFAGRGGNEDVGSVMEVLDTVNDEMGDDDDDDDGNEEGVFTDGETDEGTGYFSDDTTSSFSIGNENKNEDINDANDNESTKGTKQKLKTHTNQSSSSTFTSSDQEDAPSKNPLKNIKRRLTLELDKGDDENDARRGVMAQVRDYKKHRKELHRRHRGVMQWRGARSAEWAVGKVRGVGRRVEDKITGRGEEKGMAVEREV